MLAQLDIVGNIIVKFHSNSLSGFDNKKNPRWLMAAMFIDGPEFVSVLAQFDIEGNILTKFFFF